MNKLGIKLLSPDAKVPMIQREGDAAHDIYSVEDVLLNPGEVKGIDCGFALEIPPGFKVMINGRSGLAKAGIFCHVGTIDSNYKGKIGTILVNTTQTPYQVLIGDRVGQISLQRVELLEFSQVEELSTSNRGTNGFGSSGR